MPHLPKALSAKLWLRFIVEHPFQVIIPIAIITLFFASQLPKLHFQTSIYDLAIEDLKESAAYESFKKTFGTEEIILVVAKAENVLAPETFQKIDRLGGFLAGLKGVRRVVSLPEIKKAMDLTESWSLEDFAKIIAPIDLFQKNLISTDKKTTVITLVLEDLQDKDRLVMAVQKVLDKEGKGLAVYQIGMPIVSKAMAEYTERDFLRLPPLTFLIMGVILFLLFRNLRGILIPAGTVVIALTWTFGMMAWTGTALSMLLMIVPIFVIAVGTAYCMYIFPEYREAVEAEDNPVDVAFLCFSRMAFPTSLAVVTTSIGLVSLLINRISAIRAFALFSCFGIWSMLILMLIFLPAVFTLIPLPKKEESHGPFKTGVINQILRKVIELNLNHQKVTLPIIAVVSLIGLVGIYHIKVETNPVDFFKENTTVSRHFHDVYQDMAGGFPLNVVLDSKNEDYFEEPAHLKLIARIQGFLHTLEGMDKSISFSDYFKLINYASNKYKSEYYVLPEEGFEVRMLMNNFKTMLGQDMFDRFMTQDLSRTNILLRTHIASSKDFLKIKEKIAEYLDENLPTGFDYQVTGFGIVISQSSHILTSGQVKSLSITLILIFGIMFLLFLSSKVGLIAILPNCFPIIINFGIMGWLGVELSMATSLIASIAIGLVVDDTIHYLVRYNREFKKDLDKKRSLQDTILIMGKPIIFTTLTISLGFSILMFSSFKPIAVFGMMMVITMGTAMIADLILLPSLMIHVELITLWDLLRLKLGKDPEKGVPLFSGLSSTQVHYILMAGSLKQYDSGHVLFRKGEMSDSMYAIISGEMEVVDVMDDTDMDSMQGTKKLIATLKVGDVVGEMGMVRSCERSATVITTVPTELLEINDRMVRRLHWLYPPTAQKFFFNLMSIICNKLELTTQCLSDVTTVDSLTGLQNCDYFMNILEKEIDRANRYGAELSVCLLDLDNFKGINHIYGHEMGDRILSQMGLLLQEHVRKSDQACRYSGQQFAVMLVNNKGESTGAVCERFRRLIAEHAFGEEPSSPIYITVSIGFVNLNRGVSESSTGLMRMASKALREAKASGRNCVSAYD